MRLMRPALMAVVASVGFASMSHAQNCFLPATFCEAIKVNGTYIENPDCAWTNHFFLLGDTPASNPSDGYAYNPNGSACGSLRNGLSCGVKTTTNTCAEDTTGPPTSCSTSLDPSCECGPGDYTCNLPADPGDGDGDGGGGGGGGGDTGCGDPHPCADGVAIVLEQEASQAPLPGAMSALLQELARANGIHIEATVRFINATTGATKSTAAYEYWERGGSYRIRLSPGGSFPWGDMAFDGTFTQGKPAPDAVEVQRGGDRRIPFPDGPLALALAPLRLNNPSVCLLCQLRLADLKQAIAWRDAARPTLAKAEQAIRQGTYDAGFGRQGEVDAQGRLVRIIWPADAQHHSLDVMLDNYRPLSGTTTVFPMRLLVNLAPDTSVEYTLEKVELSPSFSDAQVFNLSSGISKFVYTTFDKNGAVHTKVQGLPPLPTTTKVPQAPAN